MKYKSISIFVCLTIIWLALCQLLVLSLQRSAGEQTARSIEYLLRENIKSDDMGQISGSLANLESIGLIRCVRLQRLEAQPRLVTDTTYRNSCTLSEKWLLNGQPISERAKSLNGLEWQ